MQNILYRFIILLFLILYIRTDPSEYYCDDIISENLKVGEEVILCIHFISHYKKEKVGIRINVDEYSVVSLDGIYDKYKLSNIGDRIELLAQIGNITSVFTSVSLN